MGAITTETNLFTAATVQGTPYSADKTNLQVPGQQLQLLISNSYQPSIFAKGNIVTYLLKVEDHYFWTVWLFFFFIPLAYHQLMTKRKASESIESKTVISVKSTIKLQKFDALPEEFISQHSVEFIKACNHILSFDPELRSTILSNNFLLYLKNDTAVDSKGLSVKDDVFLQNCFVKLATAIINQQLSNKAAKSIADRFKNYFDGVFPTFETLYTSLRDPIKREEIKKCGLSERKTMYMESLSQYFTEKREEILTLFKQRDNDDDVIDALVENVKGIGPWTAKMFLITGLKRLDVFAPEDLGIARGFSRYMANKPDLVKELMSSRQLIKKSKIKHKKLNWKIYDDDIMENFALRFEPFRTVFMFLLWRLSSEPEKSKESENEFMAI